VPHPSRPSCFGGRIIPRDITDPTTPTAAASGCFSSSVYSPSETLLRRGLFTNRPLLLAVAGTVLLQLAVVYVPPMQAIFRTVPLAPRALGLCAAASAALLFALEGGKYFLGLARGRSRE